MKILSVFLWPLLAQAAFAGTASPAQVDSIISDQVAKQYEKFGGSPKALKHLACVLKNQRNARFALKSVRDKSNTDVLNKCNRVEGGKPEVSINRDDYAMIIDFTKKPTERRMFLIPLSGKGNVEVYYNGHGRFGNVARNTWKAPEKGNSIDTLRFFSNKLNSNATATGLFIAGDDYFGHYNGAKMEVTKKTKKGKKYTVTQMEDPKHPKHSMILYGVEADINDNACERATVIHGTTKISESGKDEGVHLMSSGCPMVDYHAVEHIVERLHGEQDKGGAAILAYGPREAQLDDEYYCELRADQMKPTGADKLAEFNPKPGHQQDLASVTKKQDDGETVAQADQPKK